MTVKEIFTTMEYGPAPESDKNAQEFLEKHGRHFGVYINGEWMPGNASFPSLNPATGETLAQITAADENQVNAAVEAAKNALPHWKTLPGHERAKYLYALARQIQKHARLFAVLETLDNGKPIRESRDIDIPLVARHFYHHAGWAQVMETELPEHEAIGVIGQIVPWNFPLLMLSWKIAPALAMGNTLVLKPAEQTSLTALLFAEICTQVKLPKGVVNVITGDGNTGAALTAHPDIQKIAFTGSTEVGKIIRRSTAGSGKKLSLELGGKSPFIVFEDADLDAVVEGVVDAIWFNQGQVCCAGSRLLVQESIEEKLYEKIKSRLQKLVVGSPLDKGVDMGAIVSQEQLATIKKYVELGKAEGYSCWQTENIPGKGFFFPPTLFTHVTPSATVAQEEIFGPVLVAMSFRSHGEAVKLANNTRYGLAASIWTENINLALDIAPKIKAGTVWINATNVFDAASGFGGYRESGFGREGGAEGLWEYVKPKAKAHTSHVKISTAEVKITATLDRTPKMYIGGKQARPDSGYSVQVLNPAGQTVGEVGEGTRKDIRNAVEAAHAQTGWAGMSGHARAQVLYYLAENLSARASEFELRLVQCSGYLAKDAQTEVEASIDRLFTYAAYADKYDGKVHGTPGRQVTLAMNEPLGVLGIICPNEHPLLGMINLLAPALAMGNTVVLVPSEIAPLSATDFYQVLDTSDVPGGTVNIITGEKESLAKELAKHFDVDGIWYFGQESGAIETLATESMKRTWVNYGQNYDWLSNPLQKEFLRKATEVKNIWIPYGA
jgi:aldehyde dehydrogenase (NAD+)